MAETGRNSRITAFKNVGQGSNELRRKRAELSVTLRKQARDEQLLKRRAVSPEASLEEQQTEADTLPNPAEIVLGLKSSNVQLQLSCARAARRILSREQSPPITQLVEAGVIKPLVEALDRDDCSDLQFEAAWALTNIASGTQAHTLAVVKSGAIPRLVALVGRGGSVAEQCIWALGNVAGDGAATRDAVLQHGALPAMLPALSAHAPTALLRTAAWTYSNFCRNKNPLVRFELVSPALPHVSELLEISDHDVLADTCWALSYLTDGPDERIERVQLTPGLLERLVPLLAHASPAVRTPALRALGNMLTGSDVQTQRCLDAGCLGHIMSLLRCGKPALIKEAAWAASNILAGSQQQIKQAIDAGLLPKLVEVLEKEEVKCQKEAAWAITNLCLGGAPAQLEALLRAGFLRPFCALLDAADARAVLVALDGLSNLLQAAAKYGELDALCLQIEEVGALDRIEALQKHDNEEIYQKAVKMLDAYFSDAGEAESAAVVDNELCLSVPGDQQFNF